MNRRRFKDTKKENTIETTKYHPKVDISHYFGYGGHDIIA